MIRPNRWLRMCLLSLAGSFILAACGCSQVRLIGDTAEGGVVSMPNNSNQWPTYYRNRAKSLMRKKCPEGYVIDREQVVEDNPMAQDGRKPNETFEYNGAYERITNYRREEYHITFRRVALGKRAPSQSAVADTANESPPVVSPPSPADEEDKLELPPPRSLPSPSRP